MTLDLDDLTCGWDCKPGEIRARLIVGRDGHELVQLRLDLGVMQMVPDGRPDGETYRGMPDVQGFVERERRKGRRAVAKGDLKELERELLQFNYRRLAFCTLAEEALSADEQSQAQAHIERAVRDIDSCLAHLRLLRELADHQPGEPSLKPTLIFARGRLLAQLRVVEGRHEEAIEIAEETADRLEALLNESGMAGEELEADPGIQFLRAVAERLRQEYNVTQTLKERLDEAIESENFEEAATLRDELRRREQANEPPRE